MGNSAMLSRCILIERIGREELLFRLCLFDAYGPVLRGHVPIPSGFRNMSPTSFPLGVRNMSPTSFPLGFRITSPIFPIPSGVRNMSQTYLA